MAVRLGKIRIEGQDDTHFKGLSLEDLEGFCVRLRDFSVEVVCESLISILDSWQHSVTIQIEVNIGLRGVFECAADGNSA